MPPPERHERARTLRRPDSHRRAASLAAVVLVLALACSGFALVRAVLILAIRDIEQRFGTVFTLAVILLIAAAVLLAARARRWLADRRLTRWVTRTGWAAVRGRRTWPWSGQQPTPDAVTVTYAISGQVRGLPVTVGQLRWRGDGLGGAADGSTGQGIFGVLRLPEPYGLVAVQRRRDIARRRRGENRFTWRYRIVIHDMALADQVTNPTLWRAHLRRRIQPWTLLGDELLIVARSRRPLSGRRVEATVKQLMDIAGLLDIIPTGPAPHSTIGT